MRCLECGEQSNYHRVVVELVTGTLLGSYCVDCERRRFGDRLDGGDDRCVRCDRPGHYLLPVHYLDFTAPEASVERGWDGGDAPRLCFDHLLDLARPAELATRRRRGEGWHGLDR